jgi:adenosylcobinamide-phosphate synthase
MLCASTACCWRWLLDMLLLYLTLGFRQFSHFFTDIRDALERGDETAARRVLAEWRHLDASELPRTELLRHVIEHALLAAHRMCSACSSGSCAVGAGAGAAGRGAVPHGRVRPAATGATASVRWTRRPTSAAGTVAPLFNADADHVPARLTAFGFAVVGNFEEAINAWRRDAVLWQHPNEGIILASAAGALGLQLGGQAAPGDARPQQDLRAGAEPDSERPGSTGGMPPTLAHLQSVVAWCGARWCCGCCCWRCCRWPTSVG